MNVQDANRLLLEVGSILDSLGVWYFLTYGTCLGIYRDKTLLAHDKDLDIGMLMEDLETAIGPIAQALDRAGYRVKIKNAEFHYGVALTAFSPCGLHVDIAGFIKTGQERYAPSTRCDFCLVYPADMLETVEEIDYLGRSWRVPSPVERYLSYHYGNSWMTPDPGWRDRKSAARIFGYYHKVNGGPHDG